MSEGGKGKQKGQRGQKRAKRPFCPFLSPLPFLLQYTHSMLGSFGPADFYSRRLICLSGCFCYHRRRFKLVWWLYESAKQTQESRSLRVGRAPTGHGRKLVG